MCGIIGYVGHRPAVPVVMEGLARLEYRGYDSAGVAWLMGNKIHVARSAGKLRCLAEKLETLPAINATCAMGHTRWATHGAPVERNAHPHRANDNSLAIVHNGIIENYHELKTELQALGYKFASETDTEVLVNLIAEEAKTAPDLLHAFARALKRARGAYAVCLMAASERDVLYAARVSAPLIFGKGIGENFIASDIPAFLPFTRNVTFLEDGDIIRFQAAEYEIFSASNLEKVERPSAVIQWDMQAAQKDGYRHFMLKEIFEQPRVVRDALTGRINMETGAVILPEMATMSLPTRITIVACGTSYHSGLWARQIIEAWAGIPVQVEIASEFRYREYLQPGSDELFIFISQSGETADTLAALRRIKEKGGKTLGLCNVVGSSIAREADLAVFTQAGPEISVASTKAMCSQMLALTLFALYWSQGKNLLPEEKRKEILKTLLNLPAWLDDRLPEMRKRASELARKYSASQNFFFLGRGQGWPLALEGALKLKELSYIHAEGYAAGEMKHGPIALIDSAFPTFAICLSDGFYEKNKSNIREVEARNGKVIALANPGTDLIAEDLWLVDSLPDSLSGFVILPALQLFSYEMADYLGKDVDQPRNLAKSVTVE